MKQKITLYVGVFMLLLNSMSYAQFTKLHDFASGTPLLPSQYEGAPFSDGTYLYGLTRTGTLGTAYQAGVMYKIKLDGTQNTNFLLESFGDGKYPEGALISDGTYLYGTTSSGGTNMYGTIFKVKPDGSGYTKLLDFDKVTNGSSPQGALISDGTYLYGMTNQGGDYNGGTIFKIKPDGTGFTKLFDFNPTGTGSNVFSGSNPYSSLYNDGTYLYGTTSTGSSNTANGNLFKIKLDGSGYTEVYNLYQQTSSATPIGDGTYLYFTASSTVYKIKPDGTGLTILHTFSGLDGNTTQGSLISDGTYLYGKTYDGGAQNLGVIYKIKLDGTGFTKLLDFNYKNGKSPQGSLSLSGDGTYLYGTTKDGGIGYGVVFKMKTDGTEYTNFIKDFSQGGAVPYGPLIGDGTYLYGMTSKGGGAHSAGAIFKIKPDGTGYEEPFFFSDTNGVLPMGSLYNDGTYLYGTTNGGGPYSKGLLFKVKPDGTGYQDLYNFGGLNGSHPRAAVVSDGTYLYGTTRDGGLNDTGIVFKIKPDGTGFTRLLDFNGTIGAVANTALLYDGTYLYGTTLSGGANNKGVIYKIKPDGTGFSKLLDFNGTNGNSPNSSLISDGTYLYGMTVGGGVNNDGVIYKIKPDGTGYTKLFDFDGLGNGMSPEGALVYDGTYLYGVANAGGTNNNYGLIFKIKPDGTNYSIIKYFDYLDGVNPLRGLYIDGTSLYGLNSAGGANSSGTLYKYALSCNTSSTQTVSACNQFTWNGTTYTSSGTYNKTIPNHAGCDSVMTLILTINQNSSSAVTATACSEYTWKGKKYAVSGVYKDTLKNAMGCDSIVALNLTINNLNVSVTKTNNTLTVAEASAAYQWTDCSHVAIAGATSQSFTPGISGSYMVIITKNGCTDTSACTEVILGSTGISAYNITAQVSIHPNPSNGIFTISFPEEIKRPIDFVILEISGRVVYRSAFATRQSVVNVSQLSKGVYFIRWEGHAQKLIIE